jgi:hypothetical protein
MGGGAYVFLFPVLPYEEPDKISFLQCFHRLAMVSLLAGNSTFQCHITVIATLCLCVLLCSLFVYQIIDEIVPGWTTVPRWS